MDYLGQEVDLKDLEKLTISDFRAFLAWRADQKISKSSIARSVSALKNFFRFLMREGLVQNKAIMAVRSAELVAPTSFIAFMYALSQVCAPG